MRILLTGFEPFGGSDANPSLRAANALAEARSLGVEVEGLILPVATPDAADAVIKAFRSIQPEAVVLLGESSRATAITLERVAINLRNYRIPDNRGVALVDQPVVPGAPAAYFSTLPLRDLEQAVIAAGVPAELSLSAGSFLCNEVMFALLHETATRGPAVPVGFVHLPRLPEQALTHPRGQATMDLATSVRGLTALLRALADHCSTHRPRVG